MKEDEITDAEIINEEKKSITPKKKMGRPQIHIDKNVFEELCSIQCTEEEIAKVFRCSIDTVNNWCKREYGQTFSDVYKIYSVDGKIALRRRLFKMSEKNAAVLIFLTKNIFGYRDNPIVEDENKAEYRLVDDEEED